MHTKQIKVLTLLPKEFKILRNDTKHYKSELDKPRNKLIYVGNN